MARFARKRIKNGVFKSNPPPLGFQLDRRLNVFFFFSDALDLTINIANRPSWFQKKFRRPKLKVRLNLRDINYLFREIHKIRLAYNVLVEFNQLASIGIPIRSTPKRMIFFFSDALDLTINIANRPSWSKCA